MHVWRVGLFVLPGRRFGLSAMPDGYVVETKRRT